MNRFITRLPISNRLSYVKVVPTNEVVNIPDLIPA
jgi:hypothetical protein